MKKETTLELFAHALRWSNNQLTEMVGNFGHRFPPHLATEVSKLLMAFQSCSSA